MISAKGENKSSREEDVQCYSEGRREQVNNLEKETRRGLSAQI